MALPRFYSHLEIFAGGTLELSEEAAHHATRVLRLKAGDPLVLFNGTGGEFRATIDRVSRSGTTVAVGEYSSIDRESRLQITLAQAICASEKMDWIIQKSVELGVHRIQILGTKQSTVKLAADRAERRALHWRQVAVSACEQCGRNIIPQVLPLTSLPEWLEKQMVERQFRSDDADRDLRFILSPTAKMGLGYLGDHLSVSSVTLLVGPEGGLTSDEEAAAAVAGFAPLNLGPRILRTETAGLAAIAAAQAFWGDLSR